MYIYLSIGYIFSSKLNTIFFLSVYTKVEGDLNTHRDNIASSTLEEGEKGKTRWSPHQEKPSKKGFIFSFFFLKTYIYLEWLLSFFSFFLVFFTPRTFPGHIGKKYRPVTIDSYFWRRTTTYTGKENGAIKR
jgi:hypothetical protein